MMVRGRHRGLGQLCRDGRGGGGIGSGGGSGLPSGIKYDKGKEIMTGAANPSENCKF